MTNRMSITDLPNPAKRIAELESELLRVRAANDVFRHNNMILTAELATATAARDAAHEKMAVWVMESNRAEKRWAGLVDNLSDTADRLTSERDALRARLQAVEAAAKEWKLLCIQCKDVGTEAFEFANKFESERDALRAELAAVAVARDAAQLVNRDTWMCEPLPGEIPFKVWMPKGAYQQWIDLKVSASELRRPALDAAQGQAEWWRDYIDLAWKKAEEYSGGDPEKFIRFLAGALPAKTTSEDMEWAAEVAKQLGVGTPTDALPPQVRGDGEETK